MGGGRMEIFRPSWRALLKGFLAVLAIHFFASASNVSAGGEPAFTFVMIEYSGGSWQDVRAEQEAHVKNFIPNFLKWLNVKKLVTAKEQPEVLKLSDAKIFNFPFMFINGHFPITMSDIEKQNLKLHLERGGFLYIEDCGGSIQDLAARGSFAKQIHEIVQGLFPEGKFQTLPVSHDIYRFPFEFPAGLPNIYGEDNNPAPESAGKKRKGQGGEGFYHKGRMIAFYSDADACCGWDFNGSGHWGDIPFKVGANVVTYALTH